MFFSVGYLWTCILLLLSLFSTADSSPLEKRGPTCTNITITVSCVSNNADFPARVTWYELPTLINSLVSLTFTSVVNGPFNITATYCEPEIYNPNRTNTLQFLNHGATYTKSYWFGDYLDTQYSWVDYASKQGYPTLSIDRLGNGDSDHPDPILVVQYPTEVEVAHQITVLARSGALPGPAARTFNKIIYVGHSYGSVIGNNLNLHHPSDCDAMILTGFSSTPLTLVLPDVLIQAEVLPAAVAEPTRYGNLSAGYLEITSFAGYTSIFFGPVGTYDPGVLYADFARRGTVTAGEAATIPFGTSTAGSYTGPVFVITGQHDAIFCNPTGLGFRILGIPPQCTGNFLFNFMESTRRLYPSSSSFNYYVPPTAGHCWQLHYDAYVAFGKAHQWLSNHGF